MRALGYISDTEVVLKGSLAKFQIDGAVKCKWSERSPVPPAFFAKHLHGEASKVFNVGRIKRINCHSANHDQISAPESISDTKNWLDGNGDFDCLIDSEDNWKAGSEPEIELDNSIEDRDTPEQ
jgi:hypothetical protein